MKPLHPAFSESPLPLFARSSPAPEPDEVVVVPSIPSALAKGRLPSYISDHRQRLRHRLLDGGADAMPDYEMLELVLFRAIPRQDVKPLARRLLDRFGDFNGVITATSARLSLEHGVGDAVILELKIVEAAARRLARARVMHRPVISSWNALLEYCQTAMAHRETEQFRVFYLDRKNTLIADEAQAQGTCRPCSCLSARGGEARPRTERMCPHLGA
jgi:DNA repair protein RadC